MENSFFTELLAFNTTEITPGDVIHLIQPSSGCDDNDRVFNCIVKKVSPFKITLFVARLNSDSNEFEYKIEEKEYPIDAFHGVGCYKLKHIVSKKEQKEEQL